MVGAALSPQLTTTRIRLIVEASGGAAGKGVRTKLRNAPHDVRLKELRIRRSVDAVTRTPANFLGVRFLLATEVPQSRIVPPQQVRSFLAGQEGTVPNQIAN